MFPGLNRGQKDLATYLMGRNGLLEKAGVEQVGQREKVLGEMVGLLARGVAKH